MAVNNERSMNHDLFVGATERTHHNITPGRGGLVETDYPIWRATHLLAGSWSPAYLADAVREPRELMPDYCLRDRVSIVTGPTARTRPVAHNQFEANPFDTPLDAVHTSWPNQY